LLKNMKTTKPLLSVQEATTRVLETATGFGVETVSFETACGRILQEPLRADRDMPPFNRVMMDGIAINHADWAKGQRVFPIAGTQFAGMPAQVFQTSGTCWEVMTGAPMVEGTDTVVPYEDLRMDHPTATILLEEVTRGQHVHHQGTDQRTGDVLLEAGVKLTAADIALAASVGKTMLSVSKLPRVAVVASGDELVSPHDTPLPYQIRQSNIFALKAALGTLGIQVDLFVFRDDLEELSAGIPPLLGQYEVLMLSGGISKGRADFIPQVLKQAGLEVRVDKVAQKPGKPFLFGLCGKVAVFAFPGNPVSTFMCYHRYFLPWLQQSLGTLGKSFRAVLAEDVPFKPNLAYFLQVKVTAEAHGGLLAFPVPGNGSGDFANLAEADAFLELPAGQDLYRKGEAFPLIPYRWPG
jgi:molybdopterin molybdotransferase